MDVDANDEGLDVQVVDEVQLLLSSTDAAMDVDAHNADKDRTTFFNLSKTPVETPALHSPPSRSILVSEMTDMDIATIETPTLHPPPLSPTLLADAGDATDMDRADQIEYCTSEAEDATASGESTLTYETGGTTAVDGSEAMDLADSDEAQHSRSQLRELGIEVDSRYNLTICIDCSEVVNYQHIHGHRHTRHCHTPDQRRKLGQKDSLLHLLTALNAHRPRVIPPGPISPIRMLPIITAYRCGVPACSEQKVFSSKQLVSRHCARLHPAVPPNHRPCQTIEAQRIGQFRGTLQYVAVTASHHSSQLTDTLSDILDRYKCLSVGVKSPNFQMAKNARAKSEFLAKTKWDTILSNVNLAVLRNRVAPPDPVSEQALCQLKQLLRAYYHNIAAELDFTVSSLVLRHIHSPDPEQVFTVIYVSCHSIITQKGLEKVAVSQTSREGHD